MSKRQRLCGEHDVLAALPTELWHEVFLRVGFFDLMVSLPRVSKTIRLIVGEDNDYLWYNLCKRVFGVEHIRLHSSLIAFFSRGWKEVFEARVKLLLRLSGADLAAIANFPQALISEERIWEPQSYHLRLAVGLNDLPEMKEILNILKHRNSYEASCQRFLYLLHPQEEFDVLSQYAFFGRTGDDGLSIEKKLRCVEFLAEVSRRVEFLRRGAGVLKPVRRMSREGLLPTHQDEEGPRSSSSFQHRVAASDLKAVQTCVFVMRTLGSGGENAGRGDALVVECTMASGRIHLAFLDLKHARKEVVINGETLNSMHLRNFTSTEHPSVMGALLERLGVPVDVVPNWLFYFFLVFVCCLGFSNSSTAANLHLDSLVAGTPNQARSSLASMQYMLSFLTNRGAA
jgi:hypothetical protein